MSLLHGWKAEQASQEVMAAIQAFLPICTEPETVRSKLRATLKGHVDDYEFNRTISASLTQSHLGKLDAVAKALLKAVAALDKSVECCDAECTSVFGVPGVELSKQLRDLAVRISASKARTKTKWTPPPNKPRQDGVDRLTLDLAHIFHTDLKLPIATRAAKGQTTLNPAFLTLLAAVWRALPNAATLRPTNEKAWIARAKKQRSLLVTEAPTWQPQYYATK